MRNRTVRVASTLAASLVSLALFACSGASPQDVSTDDAGGAGTIADGPTGYPGQSTGPTGSSNPGTGTIPGSGSGTPGTGGMPGTGGGTDAGAPATDGEAPKGDAGPLGDASTKPGADGGDAGTLPIACSGTIEKEPNDKPSEATPFTSSICGQLKPKDDVDNLSFTLAADAKRIDATYSSTGPVAFRLTVKGQTQDALGPNSPAIPVFPGETYVFEASSNSPKPVGYELFVKVQ